MKANNKLNHSTSHLLAAAILKLYPKTKLAIGPAIEEGFYYDFEFESPILESDLPRIEKLMKKMAEQGYETKKVGQEFFHLIINLTKKNYMMSFLQKEKK